MSLYLIGCSTLISRLGRLSLPGSWLCLSHLNHFLLVLNSALNFVLYCCVGQRFASEFTLHYTGILPSTWYPSILVHPHILIYPPTLNPCIRSSPCLRFFESLYPADIFKGMWTLCRFRLELLRLFKDMCGWGKWGRHRMQDNGAITRTSNLS